MGVEEEEVQMEKLLLGDAGGGDGGWDIRWNQQMCIGSYVCVSHRICNED